MKKQIYPKKWTKEVLYALSKNICHIDEFWKNHKSAYNAAKNMGIFEEITAHMIRETNTWPLHRIKSEAIRYDTRKKFQKGSYQAYYAAWKRGILDEVCAHMPKPFKWDYSSIKEAALLCNNKTEFQKRFNRAYTISLKNGFLDDICQHMNGKSSVSVAEKEILKFVKTKFPEAKKKVFYGDHGPQFVKGFHLDVFIPEKSIGIEYDGDYWHSPDLLSLNRPQWDTESILRYHEIKDEFFKKLGIRVIHIKESEYNLNKAKVLADLLKEIT